MFYWVLSTIGHWLQPYFHSSRDVLPKREQMHFADEAATIIEIAARSRGLNQNSGIVHMAITRKQALKRIEGLIGDGSNAGIESHIAKLSRPWSGPHIRNELTTRIAEVERLASHVGDKSGADILAKIAEWRKRISEIADVDY